jgi:hypothetical protein
VTSDPSCLRWQRSKLDGREPRTGGGEIEWNARQLLLEQFLVRPAFAADNSETIRVRSQCSCGLLFCPRFCGTEGCNTCERGSWRQPCISNVGTTVARRAYVQSIAKMRDFIGPRRRRRTGETQPSSIWGIGNYFLGRTARKISGTTIAEAPKEFMPSTRRLGRGRLLGDEVSSPRALDPSADDKPS